MVLVRSGRSAMALGLLVWLLPARASADAVPPPSVLCGKNERVVVDHGGGHCEPTSCPPGKVIAAPGGGHPRCVATAPKDCPAGWAGVPGPHCSLALCSDAVACPTGTVCKASPVCSHDDQGYSEAEPDPRSLRGLFAAPRALAPSREYRAACDASQACGPNEVCRSVRVCLPASADRAAPAPPNALASRIWGASSIPTNEPPLTPAPKASGSAAPSASATPEASPSPTSTVTAAAQQGSGPAAVPPQGGRGGAGCAAGAASGPGWLSGVGLVAAAAIVAARKRGSRRPP